MPKKPTSKKSSDKPEAEIEDADVVADAAEAVEDALADAATPDKKKSGAEAAGDEAKADDAGAPSAEDDADALLADDEADALETDDDLEPEQEGAPDEPEVEEPEAEHEHDDHADEYHDEHEHERRPTLAGRVLTGLIIFLVGAAVALWAAPRMAPHLPAGMAKYLETGSTVGEDDLARLRAAFDGRMRAIEAKTLGVATVTELVDTQLGATRTTLEGRIGELADKIAATDSAAIESRLSEVETRLAGLDSRLAALSDGLTSINVAGAGLTDEDAARIAGFAATVEGLRAEIANLSQKSGALSQRIDEVAAAAARRVKEAEAAAETLKTEAETAIKGMALVTALDELEFAVASGAQYDAQLADLAEAAGADAPAALSAPAATGVSSHAALRAAFPEAAHAAIAAAIEADAREGFANQASAWFKSQFTGLPVEETAGDDVPAILSRVSARLAERDLDAALAEAAALPEAAANAMAPWIAAATERRDALAALAAWRVTLAADG